MSKSKSIQAIAVFTDEVKGWVKFTEVPNSIITLFYISNAVC